MLLTIMSSITLQRMHVSDIGLCVCIIYSYNNEGTIGYKNSNTNIIKNKNGLTD